MKKYLLIVLLLSFSFYVYGEVPPYMNVQGFLRSEGGVPVNGTFNMKFSLYDAQTLGNEKWTETHSNVSVEKGLFSVILGKTPFGNVFVDNPTLWLEVQIGDDPALPRQQIHSVAYAFKAGKADSATNANQADIANIAKDLQCPANISCVEAGEIASESISTSHISNSSIKLEDLSDEVKNSYVKKAGDEMSGALKITIPFKIDPPFSITNHNFVVDKLGNVGIGTVGPQNQLHLAMVGSTIPRIRFDGGTGSRVWILGMDTSPDEFYIQDITNSNAQPFRIEGGAPSNSLYIKSTGNVGIGTSAPASQLHVTGGVQVGNDSGTCNDSKGGTLRWTGNSLEVCNGKAWIQIVWKVWEDNFDDNLLDGWEVSGSVSVSGGVVYGPAGSAYINSVAKFNRPLRFEMRMKAPILNECVVMRIFPQNVAVRHTGYNFGPGWWGWQWGYGTDGGITNAGDDGVGNNEWRVYRMDVNSDGTIKTYLDDNLKAQWSHSGYTSGTISIGVSCVNWEVDWVKVTPL